MIAINLIDSQESNRYFCPKLIVEGTTIGCSEGTADDTTEQFTYTYLGKSKDGIHMLRTVSSSSHGSGVFTSLMLLRLENAEGLALQGKKLLPEPRLLVTKLAEIPLGDRPHGKPVFKDEKIFIEDGKKVQVLFSF